MRLEFNLELLIFKLTEFFQLMSMVGEYMILNVVTTNSLAGRTKHTKGIIKQRVQEVRSL